MTTDTITVRCLRLHPGAHLPERATPLSAGWDLRAVAACRIEPGAFASVPTGLAIALPEGYEMQVRPRSGLAARRGVTVLNAPGTVDADYRGEVCVLLINHGEEAFDIHPGDRVAQAVIARHATVRYEAVEALEATERGEGGFGSTGV